MGAYDDEEYVEEEARTVRPYTVTGGRTRSRTTDLPLEALVRSLKTADELIGMAIEKRRILELTTDRLLSVAELSAHLALPLGVIRVLVGDLSADGSVSVSGVSTNSNHSPATDLRVLESLLNGISAL
jgi:hypothetical protein